MKNFYKFTGLGALLVLTGITLSILISGITPTAHADAFTVPTQGLTTAPNYKSFSNAPTLISASGISNASVTANTWRSNAIPLRAGKGLLLTSSFNQASNGQSASVTHYFGLIFARTNTSTFTNFSWTITAPQSTGAVRAATNLPAAVLADADAIFWFGTQNGATNSLVNNKLGGQTGN